MMGRKSSLTPDQWLVIERRHLIDGESIRALAEEFGINESSMRRKIKPHNAAAKSRTNPLAVIAKDKVAADAENKRVAEQIAALPYAKQQIVSDLARKLTAISEHIGSAAEYSSATAHRLSMLANQQMDKIDSVEPMKSVAELQAVALLQKMANTSSEIGINLLRTNKEMIEDMNKRKDDGGLGDFMDKINGTGLTVVGDD